MRRQIFRQGFRPSVEKLQQGMKRMVLFSIDGERRKNGVP